MRYLRAADSTTKTKAADPEAEVQSEHFLGVKMIADRFRRSASIY